MAAHFYIVTIKMHAIYVELYNIHLVIEHVIEYPK